MSIIILISIIGASSRTKIATKESSIMYTEKKRFKKNPAGKKWSALAPLSQPPK